MAVIEREHSVANIHSSLYDQRMPGTSGVRFLKEGARWPDIVVIILVRYTDAEDIITGVNVTPGSGNTC